MARHHALVDFLIACIFWLGRTSFVVSTRVPVDFAAVALLTVDVERDMDDEEVTTLWLVVLEEETTLRPYPTMLVADCCILRWACRTKPAAFSTDKRDRSASADECGQC